MIEVTLRRNVDAIYIPDIYIFFSSTVESIWGDATCFTLSPGKDCHLPTMVMGSLPLLNKTSVFCGGGLHRDPPEPP